MQRDFPDRSLCQLKSYYHSQLKPDTDRKNTKWTPYLVRQLHSYVDTYGKKWGLISRNYFPNVNPEALRVVYARGLWL